MLLNVLVVALRIGEIASDTCHERHRDEKRASVRCEHPAGADRRNEESANERSSGQTRVSAHGDQAVCPGKVVLSGETTAGEHARFRAESDAARRPIHKKL